MRPPIKSYFDKNFALNSNKILDGAMINSIYHDYPRFYLSSRLSEIIVGWGWSAAPTSTQAESVPVAPVVGQPWPLPGEPGARPAFLWGPACWSSGQTRGGHSPAPSLTPLDPTLRTDRTQSYPALTFSSGCFVSSERETILTHDIITMTCHCHMTS